MNTTARSIAWAASLGLAALLIGYAGVACASEFAVVD